MLGVMSLEALRRLRERGELSGEELAWRAGMAEWRPLAEFLGPPRAEPRFPPPLTPAKKPSRVWLYWLLGGGAVFALCLAALGFWAARAARRVIANGPPAVESVWTESARADGLELVGPIRPRPESRTIQGRRPEGYAFRERHYIEGYTRDGRPAAADADEERRFIQLWIDLNFGEAGADAEQAWRELGQKLVAKPEGRDALVLMTLALGGFAPPDVKYAEFLETAVNAFEGSRHRPYPRFCAVVNLAAALPRASDRIRDLDARALELLRDALSGRDLAAAEQEILGDNLVGGWGEAFFKRNPDRVCELVEQAGKDWRWLALLLSGERYVAKAWAVRGGGYARTVTEDGWAGFGDNLEKARVDLEAAWRLAPNRPLAPARMIAVAMGRSRTEDMRVWFDRALDAQIDHKGAWGAMRWALWPRWFGSHEAVLALGVAAVDTGRFDTDAPRQLIDAIFAVENDAETKAPRLFARRDVWPQVRRMYEGYLAEPSQARWRDGWRTAYASAAYLAEEYDEARAQLEKLDWRPLPGPLQGWGADLSRMHLEVAARTGPQARRVAEAEALWARGGRDLARERYREILKTSSDARTLEWARFRAGSQ